MTRRRKSRSTLAGTVAICVLLLSPGSTTATPPAADEYILDLPGTDMSALEDWSRERDPVEVRPDGGIVGERSTVPTPLASLTSAALTPAGVLILAVPALLAAGLLRRRGKERR
jgi:hypothetical protein